jgi:phage tail-like protein
MAFDASLRLHLLSEDRVLAYDPAADGFRSLETIGGHGEERRRFKEARQIAIIGRTLLVADTGNESVKVFSLDTLMLTDVFHRRNWRPVDVATDGHVAYVLDDLGRRVFRYSVFPGVLEPLFSLDETEGACTRLIVDRAGSPYVLRQRGGSSVLVAFAWPGPAGGAWQRTEFERPGDVRDRFDPPALRCDERGWFRLPASLRRRCDRAWPPRRPSASNPLAIEPVGAASRAGGRGRSAAGAGWTYVIDERARQVHLESAAGARRRSWGPFDESGRMVAGEAAAAWHPVDVTTQAGCAFILDGRHGRVWRHRFGRETLQVLFTVEERAGAWTRIVVDQSGCLLLLHAADRLVEVYDQRGVRHGERAASDVRFPDGNAVPAAPATHEVFDRRGGPQVWDPTRPALVRVHPPRGCWVSEAIDSRLHQCVWDRIELDLSDLPPGCAVTVLTFTADEQDDGPASDVRLWRRGLRVLAGAQPEPSETGRYPRAAEGLVQSDPGRYLWVRLELEGDGRCTPAVREVRLPLPRESWVNELPAVFAADPETRRFLERFLAIFQREQERIESHIDEVPALFDPEAVADGKPMAFLADRLALPLERTWTAADKRRLLVAAPGVYPRRGRIDGLRDMIEAYVGVLARLEPDVVRAIGFPRLLEGFQERAYVMLGQTSVLGGAMPLWSRARTNRFRLDERSWDGEAELVATGDPERDLFHEYAHRFRVFVPAAWVASAAAETTLRRAIDQEKPAHARYDLCLVPSRLQVGSQATVGVDTIVGELAPMRLGCLPDESRAPSAEPPNALGRSARLGGTPASGSFALRHTTRVGIDTVLT